ncbi:hypothetical protein [Cerasicoccus arenae]|uniref:Uncharacterized protein n=1 Tax=Cerasicoccus arenae TaxID=424488 RepID=A0A8J3DKW0_9BACT|nr:hypothetical protein [Cerasicoccus arenae]MBK1858578.1 hypothetical protein [Cerasicoccus arenae]GHC05200.1 hypothetical protein GCM10007047_22740 [Cerasicoccus arenae]
MSNSRQIPGFVYWPFCFLGYYAAVVLVGAIIGALGFSLIGALTNPDLTMAHRAMLGVGNGGELAGKVWAPAISLVLCVMQAHRRNQRKALLDPRK